MDLDLTGLRSIPAGRGARLSRTFRQLRRNYRLGLIGGSLLAIIVFVAVFAPVLAPASPNYQNIDVMLTGPSLHHPIGVDDLGRDVLSRLMYGARVSLIISVAASAVAGALGLLFGVISGYFGGWIDTVIMRIMDVIFAFPTLVLAIAIVGTLGPSLRNSILAISIVIIPRFARLSRAEVLKLRTSEFVLAAVTLGAASKRILARHILPNIIGIMIVQFSLSVATAILSEASLSFLGLGVQPPTPSWGSMLRAGYPFLSMAPWIAIAPGVTITLAVLGFTFVGDAVRDYLDPRLRVM